MKLFLVLLLIFLSNIAIAQVGNISIDSLSGYSFIVPTWLVVKETENKNLFGGTLPSINGIENAILVTTIPKASFSTFEEFQNHYLTSNKFGQPAKFSKEHIWYGQNEISTIPGGVEQKVFLFWRNKIYHNKFVLLQTRNAYLWIQFVATPDTYEANIGKFNEFMSGLKVAKD